ncbi:7424_t:CDS:2, partial [Gigaspora rosea]
MNESTKFLRVQTSSGLKRSSYWEEIAYAYDIKEDLIYQVQFGCQYLSVSNSQVLPMQIGRDLNSLFHYNCSLEDRPKFIVQILDLENVVVRSEELRKESVDADKVVKVACFLVAAVFEIAVVIANFYFQGVFDVFLSCVFLNCPSAIIIFVAAARNKNTVMAFSVE